MKKELKLFVGGYYDDRIFVGEKFEGKTPFGKNIDIYTLSEALKLGFVEGVKEWFSEENEKDFDELDENEKIEAIINYTDGDEIAGILYFDNEEEASEYKASILKEIKDIELNSEYDGKTQDNQGNFRETYIQSCTDED